MPLPIKIEVRRREEEKEVPRADICFRISAVGKPTFSFVAGEQHLVWNGNEANPGESVEIPVGTRIYPSVRIKNTGDTGADCRIRVDRIDTTPEENVFYAIEYIAKNGELNYKNAGYFVMPAHSISVIIRACHNNGEVDCIHDNTATFTLNVAKEPKACFLAVDNYFDNVPSSLEIVVGDAVDIGSGCMNCGGEKGNIHTTTYVDGALCADAFESLPVGTANDIARDPDTYSVKASCATFDMPDRAVKVDRYGEHWDGSKWVEDFHISFMLTPKGVAPPPCNTYTTKTSCEAAGCYWYNNTCHKDRAVLCSDYTDALTCVANNCYWYDGSCHSTPEPECIRDTDCPSGYVCIAGKCVKEAAPGKCVQAFKVEDGKGNPIEGAKIRYSSDWSYSTSYAYTKADGIAIEDGEDALEEGVTYEAIASKYGYDGYDRDRTASFRACTSAPLLLKLRGCVQTFKVVDGKGNPIEGAKIRYSSDWSYSTSYAYTKADGIAIEDGEDALEEGVTYEAIASKYVAEKEITCEKTFVACEDVVFILGEKPSFQVTVTNTKPETCLLCHHNERFLLEWIPKEVCWRRITTEGQVETFTADDGLIPGDEYSFTCGHVMTGGCIQYPPISRLWETFEGEKKVDVVCPTVETPWAYLICRHFNVSDEECNAWILSWVLDPVFLAEEITIVKEGKNLAGEPVTATHLDKVFIVIATLGIASPGFSEGMILKQFKELIRLSKGSDEFAILLRTEDVANFLSVASYKKIKSFTALCRGGKFDDAIKLVDNLPEVTTKNADWVFKRYDKWYELLGKGLGKTKATEVIVKHGISKKLKGVIVGSAALIAGLTFKQILVMWFMVDNLPFYIYMWLKWHGKGPGDVGYEANERIDLVETDSWTVRRNLELGYYELAREAIVLYEEHLESAKTYIDENEDTLKRSNDYDTSYGGYVTFALLLTTLKLEAGVITWPEEFTAMCRRTIDGDTIDIEYRVDADGNAIDYEMAGEVQRFRVRIVGINTPEMRDKKGDLKCTTTTPAAFNVAGEWADKATKLMTTLEDQIVTIRTDLNYVYGTKGRLLAVVVLNGVDMGLEEIKQGLACYYFRDPHDKVDDAEYLAAETAAKEAKIGIWSLPLPDTGKIHCLSSPSTAEIWLGTAIGNEENTGYTTPKTLDEIAVGDYIVTFKAPLTCEKDAERCALIQCSKKVKVFKDETADTDCVLCAIYEIRQPYYCKDRVCVEGIEKREMDAEIWLDGHRTNEFARGDRTIIKFGTDIDGNAFTFGDWHRECNLGSHTIELRRDYHKTIKITKNIKKGGYYGDDMEYEMPEGKPEEVVVPTPTPVPGEEVPPVEGTGVLHVGDVYAVGGARITGNFKIWLKRAGEFECDCHNYTPGDIVFGPGKFCDPKKEHRKCSAELGTYTLIIKHTGYERFEYPFTIEAGDNITVPTIYMKEQAAITSATDLTESLIPAEIYLNTAAQFTIKVKNTSEYPLQYKLNLGFSGVDTANEFAFHPDIEWSETVDAGGETMIPVSVTLPSDALPMDKEEATYDIKTLLEAKVM